MLLTLENLKAFLSEKGLQPQVQPETQQVFILFKVQNREFPLFFRIYEGGDLLQLLAFIPCTLKPASLNDLCRLLHLFNKELDLPGFGVDEKTGVIFYRFMLPTAERDFAPHVLDALIESTRNITESFAPAIAAVAGGVATFEEVVKRFQESGGTQAENQGEGASSPAKGDAPPLTPS